MTIGLNESEIQMTQYVRTYKYVLRTPIHSDAHQLNQSPRPQLATGNYTHASTQGSTKKDACTTVRDIVSDECVGSGTLQ